MEDALILTELEAQAASMPTFMYNLPRGDKEWRWLGKTISLIKQWDSTRGIFVQNAASNLSLSLMFDSNIDTVRVAVYEAIEDLKLRMAQRPGGVFAKNAVYDFFRDLIDLIGTATTELFIVDAYLSDEIFDYLSVAPTGVNLRLMTMDKYLASVRLAQSKFQTQYARPNETRVTKDIHDRVIFVDRRTCYVVGASIKDAARKAPTYLIPLSTDLVQDKLAAYEAIWTTATPI